MLPVDQNVARIANAVHCHSKLSGNNDCHKFRFSTVIIVISFSNVISFQNIFNCVRQCALTIATSDNPVDL